MKIVMKFTVKFMFTFLVEPDVHSVFSPESV